MNKSVKTILISWFCLIMAVLMLLAVLFFKVRPIAIDYAISNAEGRLLSFADNAIIGILSDKNYTYQNISVINRDSANNITGIELNSNMVSIIKSKISRYISSRISGECFEKVSIPIGTLISSDFFYGLGPRIKFGFQFFEGISVKIENKFVDCGINQVMHQIVLKIKLTGTVITLGKSKSFETGTSAVIAQTVIVGKVPQTYLNVTK
ncbi:MAG: sporulation protein YunB [Clostridia bacterium]|nr:sporulation protein YunB [Clostridia bacterium]